MAITTRDSLTMLPPRSPRRDYLSVRDATHIYEAPRPCTTRQVEARGSISSLPLSHHISRSSRSIHSRKTSIITLSGSTSKCDSQVPRLTKTPWELERNKKNSVWRRTKLEYVLPAHIFKKLPREVYDCVVEQLEQLHFAQNQPCPSCYINDLYSLSLTSRAWDRAATLQLYRKVWVLTNEEHPKMPKLKFKGTSRLKLLRRTLRERQALARHVRELDMSNVQVLYQNASIEREEITNLVASVVMACPNLERLVGFHIPYTHHFDRLSHTLSTRRNLKERVWLLTEKTGLEDDEDDENGPGNMHYHAACDPTERFLELNSNHPNLATLILHQEQSCPSIPLTFRAIIGTFQQLPSLRHLSISGLSASFFTNLALNALPPNLQSLRLENLSGINDKGLQRFATSHLSTSLESITLMNLGISNLVTISNFLSPHLGQLKQFSLSQHRTPLLSSSVLIPDLQSQTLEYIHWEIQSQAGPPPTLLSPFASRDSDPPFPFVNSEPISCLATSLLATSIQNHLFPSLRKIRAPHDPQGLLQALCKPLATALLPSDASLLTSRRRFSPPTSPQKAMFDSLSSSMSPELSGAVERPPSPPPSPRADSAMSGTFDFHMSKPNSSSNKHPLDIPLITTMSPARSRLAAQARIVAARKQAFMVLKVTDPNGVVRVDRTFGGFMGQLDSGIVYDMTADWNRVDGVDDGNEGDRTNEWITRVGDVVGEWEVVSGGTGTAACRHLGRMWRKAVGAEAMF